MYLSYEKKSDIEKSTFNIENYLFEKLSLVMPQDIILKMAFSENNIFKKEHQKIIKYYREGEHSNLINYLKKCQKNKNIIFTFSGILEPLFPELEEEKIIKTKMLGNVKVINIKSLLVSSIKSENDLENILEDFNGNDEKKILIFKFSINEIENINYFKNYIKEMEKSDKTSKSKIYIFIIYLRRVFNNNDLDSKKLDGLKEIISFLDEDFYQRFCLFYLKLIYKYFL